jgi:tetratricopeptide (TPR) repeat protein
LGGENEAFLDTRGYLYYLLGRPKEALADLDAAIELADEPTDARERAAMGEIYYHRALIHEALGNGPEAEQDHRMSEQLGFQRPAEQPKPGLRIPKGGLAV